MSLDMGVAPCPPPQELLRNTEWRSSAARTRDFATGASHVKYDKEGKMKLQGNQGAKYTQGTSLAFDKLLQQFFAAPGWGKAGSEREADT